MTYATFDKSMTLAALIAESCTDDESKYFVFCDAGSGFGEAGRLLPYDAEAAEKYGAVMLHPTMPHMIDDRVECVYASDWIEDADGYRYQIRL